MKKKNKFYSVANVTEFFNLQKLYYIRLDPSIDHVLRLIPNLHKIVMFLFPPSDYSGLRPYGIPNSSLGHAQV